MEEFLLICMPSGTKLGELHRTWDSHLKAFLRSREAEISMLWPSAQMVWPPSEAQCSFPIYADGSKSWACPETLHITGREPALIVVLNEGMEDQDKLLLRIGNKTRAFRQLSLTAEEKYPAGLSLPDSVGTRESLLYRRAYVSASDDSPPFWPFEVRKLPTEELRDRELIALFNPAIFRLRLGDRSSAPCSSGVPPGEELGAPTGQARDERDAMTKLVEASSARGGWIGCVPIFGSEHDIRISSLVQWTRFLRKGASSEPRSQIEWFLQSADPKDDRTWLPFYALDQLGGRFVFRPLMEFDGPGTSLADKSWVCDDPPGNLLWFANHWIKRWGGRLRSVREPDPERGPVLRGDEWIDRGRGQVTLSASNEDVSDPCKFYEWLKRAGPTRPLIDRQLLEFLAELQRGAVRASGVQDSFVRPLGDGRFEVDYLGAVEEHARLALVPRSEVLCEFPLAGTLPPQLDEVSRLEYVQRIAGRAFDLVRDISYGERRFAVLRHGEWGKGRSVASAPGQGDWTLRLTWNWWCDYYRDLFHVPSDAPFRFALEPKGFVLAVSRLASGVLEDISGKTIHKGFVLGSSKVVERDSNRRSSKLGAWTEPFEQPDRIRI